MDPNNGILLLQKQSKNASRTESMTLSLLINPAFFLPKSSDHPWQRNGHSICWTLYLSHPWQHWPVLPDWYIVLRWIWIWLVKSREIIFWKAYKSCKNLQLLLLFSNQDMTFIVLCSSLISWCTFFFFRNGGVGWWSNFLYM